MKHYTCDDVATMYGVTNLTVRNWIKDGKLTAFKPGREYLIRQSDLDAFERRHTVAH